MTSDGSKYGAPNNMLQRALAEGNLQRALIACKELPRVPLRDAARLLHLMARDKSPAFDRAAARWLSRFTAEVRGVTAEQMAEVAIAVAELPDMNAAEVLLAATNKAP
jgi:hypothetical protein